MPEWRLRNLGETRGNAPSETAYAAMHFLVTKPFLLRTARLRMQYVHHGRTCPASCAECLGVAQRHAWTCAERVHRRLRTGAPRSSDGQIVRDWQTILTGIRDPNTGYTPLSVIRSKVLSQVSQDDLLRTLVYAVGTQFQLVAATAQAKRALYQAFTDAWRSTLAYQQGWKVRPGRDFATNKRLRRIAEGHPVADRLFREILRQLELGDARAFEGVLGDPGVSAAELADFQQLLHDLMEDDYGQEWIEQNVMARVNYLESDELPRDPGRWGEDPDPDHPTPLDDTSHLAVPRGPTTRRHPATRPDVGDS